jgi:pterin-4a-carbinolamine dehydratase
MIKLNLGYISIIITALGYLVVAFIQFRRSWLMHARVNHIASKGKHVPAKILSFAHNKHVEVEFINHSNTRVLTDFRINKKISNLSTATDIHVLMGDNPQNSPAIILQYGNKMITHFSKYIIFGFILAIIAFLLLLVLNFVGDAEMLSSHFGILIPVIAALGIFIGVTEDEMAENRIRNTLLLYGINATAHIRKASSTGIVKHGYKQISFFMEYLDKNGNLHFGKAEELLNMKDYQHFKKEKKVDILYAPDSRKRRCLLNYTWQQ